MACMGSKDSASDSGKDPITAVWSTAFDTTSTGALSGVWGSGPEDVWIVGGREGQAEIYHFDGQNWSPAESPAGLDLLVWVYGFGPDVAFTVGTQGSAARWDGSHWEALETGTTEDLWGVFGFSPDDLWVVGGTPDEDVPVILHYDGQQFDSVPLDPSQNSRNATSLFKVWGIDGHLWAVGQHGLILSYEGGTWVEQSGGAEASEDFVSLWGTAADHVVAVGGRGNARIARWDGTQWTTVSPSGLGGLNAVFMDSPDHAVVGGIYGYVASYDVNTGVLQEEGPVSGGDVHAIWGDGTSHYAVGGYFADPYSGLAYKRTIP